MLVLRPSGAKRDILAVGEVKIVDAKESKSMIVLACLAKPRASGVAGCCQPVRHLPLTYGIEAFQGHLP